MKLNRKIEIAQSALASITRHDDADMAVREAALVKVEEFIAAEREAMAARVQAKIEDQVGVKSEA